MAAMREPRDTYKAIEERYWDMVENGAGDPYRVEYAADLRVDKYGSGFGRPGQTVIDQR